MTMTTPAAPLPISLPGAALSSDATSRPTLIGGICRACGSRMFPAGPVCSICMSEDIADEALPREGTLYAFTTVHVGPKTWVRPYAVGYVDLENGVRVFSHLRGDPVIGGRVELAAAEIGREDDGAAITTFVFQPIKA